MFAQLEHYVGVKKKALFPCETARILEIITLGVLRQSEKDRSLIIACTYM